MTDLHPFYFTNTSGWNNSSSNVCDVYSATVIRMIKSRIRWAVNVARMTESRGAYRVLVGRPDAKDHLEGLDID